MSHLLFSAAPPRRMRLVAMALLAGLAILASGIPRAHGQESVYQGAFPGGSGSPNNITAFEASSGRGASIVNFFQNWDNTGGDIRFPTSTMDFIRGHGSIPMHTWQPEGASPDATYKLANITNGNFDAYIQQWALDARAWGHPFFLRFAHEMSGTWYPWGYGVNGNTPADYVAAWQHVHDIFVRNGAANVTWVWCVNTLYSGGAPAFDGLYPGDNYVDWISLDSYNRITNTWADFSDRSQPTLNQIIAIAPGKPILVAEAGCHEDSVYDKGQWFRNAMANYLKFSAPRIKAWCYFNGNNPDGNDWRITTSTKALSDYQFCAGLSYYSDNKYGSLNDMPIQPLVNDATSTDTMAPFVSLATPAVNRVQAGVQTELRVLASDKSGISRVDYYINGVLSFSDNSAPYQYFWTVPAGAGKTYTILAKAYDTAGNTAASTVQVVSKNLPLAPTGVSATDGTYSDKVRVTWASVGTALGYEIWRNTANNSAGAAKLNPGPVTGTTYDDTTPGYTTPYYYWVKSVDDTGPSAFSASDSGYRALPPAPAAPGGVYATDGVYNDGTLVGWNSVGTATGYEVWRNTTGSSSSTAAKLTASPVTGTSYYDTTGTYAQFYYYWVKAVNEGGSSPFSAAGGGYRGNLPTISGLADQTISQNTNTGALAFIVGDAETAAASLTLSAACSNTTLVPLTRIVFGGSGANRTVTVTPATNQVGTAVIGLTVSDGTGGSASTSFTLLVNDPSRAVWSAMGTGAVLNWTTGANWSGGVAPKNGLTSLTYLAGGTLPAGTINSNNNNPAGTFALNALNLAGTGPSNGVGTVNITGGQLNFAALGDGTTPAINLTAAAGTGASAALTYNVTLPVSLDAATTMIAGDGTATFVAAGNISGVGGIMKTGGSALVLAGANTYTGATLINAGTLVVSGTGSLAKTSGVTVGTAGTLTGGGTIGAATTVNGTHSPGNGIGTQTFTAALAYGATAHLVWGLAGNTVNGAGTSFDSVSAGVVTVANKAVIDIAANTAGSAVNFADSFWQQSRAWTVVTASSSVSGTFSLGTVSNDPGGGNLNAHGLFSVQQTSTTVKVVWTPFTPIQAWQYAYFGANWNNATVAGDNADPDGDGLPNLLEYALGKSPLSADGVGMRDTLSNGYLMTTYPLLKSATDITAQLEWSLDLRTWSTQGVTVQMLSDDGTIQVFQASVPIGSNSRIFTRLRVTRP